MSEKLYLIITGVLCSVATMGATFFKLDAIVCLILCIIPMLLIPALKFGKN